MDYFPVKAMAIMRKDGNGRRLGAIYFEQKSNCSFTIVKVNMRHIHPVGAHGLHVHQTGDLSNGCESLGGHYNPLNNDHGTRHSSVRHIGDYGNVYSDINGDINETFTVYSPIHSIVERGIVLHKNRDDEGLGSNSNSKINGNSGERIACGIINLVK